jgi:Mg/Co/Ni transporter MgtE
MQILDKKQRMRLQLNWQSISDLIEPNDGFIDELHTKNCITSRQREALEKQPSSQQIKKLVELISIKSLADVDTFINCLPQAARNRVLSLMNDDNTGNIIVS